MKTFIYKVESKKTKYGFKYATSVYKVVHNKPLHIGSFIYNSGSYRGHSHEVVNYLFFKGELPKRALTTWKEGSQVGSGYIDYAWKEKNYELFEV